MTENEYPSFDEVLAAFDAEPAPDIPALAEWVMPASNVEKALNAVTFQDSILAEYLANGHVAGVEADSDGSASMRGYLRWTPDRGWLVWTDKLWAKVPEPLVIEMARQELKKLFVTLIHMNGDTLSEAHINTVKPLLTRKKASDVVYFLRGLLTAGPDLFDSEPYLLNCQNGIVDLRTGAITAHRAEAMLTKITPGDFIPTASHADWDTALRAMPEEIREYIQVRYGQAATGYPTDDDVLLIQTGGGNNGKSTIVNGVVAALGDYGVFVPEKVLLANPGEHPTELMTLRGARMAVIEETPEGKHLPTKRLKDLVGTPVMTARAMRQDFVSWNTSHSLFLNTNYVPQVAETDHGTWRRLQLVKFPYKFVDPSEPLMAPNERHGVPGLRDRIRFNTDDQLEAVLAWVVEGARAWFDMDRRQLPVPLVIQSDTRSWQAETDLIMAFAQEKLTFDPQSNVASKDLYETFSTWLKESGRQVWNDQTFASRFGGHELASKNYVEKKRVRASANISMPFPMMTPPSGQVSVWTGVRFN